jgi:hypothetical protein
MTLRKMKCSIRITLYSSPGIVTKVKSNTTCSHQKQMVTHKEIQLHSHFSMLLNSNVVTIQKYINS